MTCQVNSLHIKFVILGEANVGKTSLITRYFLGKFHQFCESTIGCSFSNKAITIEDKIYKLDVWDTAGQEKYRGLMPMYYRNADVVFICIDLQEESREKLIENYNYWHEQISLHSDNPDRIIIIVGTKSDSRYQLLTEDEIRESLKEYNYSYFETSSKNDIGVTELFEYASCKAAKHVEKKQEKLSIDSIELTHNNINGGAKRHSSCCGN